MFDTFGKNYYLNLDNLINQCKIDYDDSPKSEDATINIFKYEILKMCVDRLINEIDDIDEVNENLGIYNNNDMPISLKITMNTLINYNILTEDDEQRID
jgi:hypothetical protein